MITMKHLQAAFLVSAFLCGFTIAASAQTTSGAKRPQADSPATANVPAAADVSRKLDDLRQQLGYVDQQIDKTISTINDKATSSAESLKQLDALKGLVSGLLAQAADNGPIAKVCEAALANARGKLKSLPTDARFTDAQRARLLEDWNKALQFTEQAATATQKARKNFVDILRQLQNQEDYIRELMAVHDQDETAKAIVELGSSLGDASGKIKEFIDAIPQPGS